MEETLTPAQATARGFISIAEALEKGLTAKHRTTLNREAKNGSIPSIWVSKGSRPCLWVLIAALDKNLPSKTVSSYEKLEASWMLKMRNGTFGNTPYSEETIKNRQWAINKYWLMLEKPKSVQELNVKNFEDVLSRFKHDIEAQKMAMIPNFRYIKP